MKTTLTIMSFFTVSVTIPDSLTVKCNGVVKYAWLGLPDGHVRCPAPGNRQPYIDIATET